MKLYQDTRAPNPRRVRMFLAEKGLSVELVTVDIAARAHQSDEFLRKHPLGLVPVLELDDGRLLRESVAICRYLEELHPEPALFGVDAWDRAVVEQWNRHMELELLFPIAQTFRNTHAFWKGRIEQAPEFGEICRRVVAERFRWLDAELAERPFIAGERFTIADITALAGIDFGRVSGIRIPADHEHLGRWYQAVSGRPSARA